MVLGDEGPGLSRLAAERCAVLALIPRRGELASLNVAVAAVARPPPLCRLPRLVFVGCDWYRRFVTTDMPGLYIYVVRHDGGHAPNPFHGFCTLATCKPQIRKKAQIGDYIAGISPKQRGRNRRLVYAMRVEEIMTFDEYWEDTRFQHKRPEQTGTLKQRCGDNYYHRSSDGSWIQEPGDHSNEDGSQNMYHTKKDTKVNRVLVSEAFVYYGNNSIEISDDLCNGDNHVVLRCGRGHRCNFSDSFKQDFIDWLEPQMHVGVAGQPREWPPSTEPVGPVKKSSGCSTGRTVERTRRSTC